MDKGFSFELKPEEKDYLLNLVRLSIERGFAPDFDEEALPQPPTPALSEPYGAFVTLKKDSRLRGCIGRLIGDAPLFLTVSRMARAAAFNDPRFPPLRKNEMDGLELEISIMGPITPCRDPGAIVIGRHGLIMKKGAKQGLLLPQVPVEWGWEREKFLDQTCLKAGLAPGEWKDAWKTPGGTELYWYEAEVF